MAQNPIFSRLRRAEKKGFYLRMLQNHIFFAPAARYKGVNRKKHWPAAGGKFWGFKSVFYKGGMAFKTGF